MVLESITCDIKILSGNILPKQILGSNCNMASILLDSTCLISKICTQSRFCKRRDLSHTTPPQPHDRNSVPGLKTTEHVRRSLTVSVQQRVSSLFTGWVNPTGRPRPPPPSRAPRCSQPARASLSGLAASIVWPHSPPQLNYSFPLWLLPDSRCCIGVEIVGGEMFGRCERWRKKTKTDDNKRDAGVQRRSSGRGRTQRSAWRLSLLYRL